MLSSLYLYLLLQLLAVTFIDIRSRKISNLWPLANLSVAILLYAFLQEQYPLTFRALVFPLGFILIGFPLFLLKIMGAGDSKYLASLFLLLPVTLHESFFEGLVISTVFIGAVLLTMKVATDFRRIGADLRARQWGELRKKLASRFSYAPVILIAWVLLGIKLWK
ncbi:MAG TPA: prepilin peptidase [Bacteriovoracaceae bacterium]|nr:prepilin peptidase [Bacteriovoracaceae bacterium]